MSNQLADLLALPPAERQTIAEALWDSLADDADGLPIPAWHAAELDRRLEAAGQSPMAVSTWDEVRRWVENRHG